MRLTDGTIDAAAARRASAAGVKRVGARGVLYATATFFALFAALPFAWMILTIFKQNTDLYNAQEQPLPLQRPADAGQPRPTSSPTPST